MIEFFVDEQQRMVLLVMYHFGMVMMQRKYLMMASFYK